MNKPCTTFYCLRRSVNWRQKVISGRTTAYRGQGRDSSLWLP